MGLSAVCDCGISWSYSLTIFSDSMAVLLTHRGLPVGFLLLRYSVLFTVESLSMIYLLFIA